MTEQGPKGIGRRQKLLSASKDRKLCRTVMAHVLKGHGT